MILYHCTTPKKLSRYINTRAILKPVRGFNTYEAAKEWARIHNRSIILKIESNKTHKLPDHHNRFGQAWWADENITDWIEQ